MKDAESTAMVQQSLTTTMIRKVENICLMSVMYSKVVSNDGKQQGHAGINR